MDRRRAASRCEVPCSRADSPDLYVYKPRKFVGGRDLLSHRPSFSALGLPRNRRGVRLMWLMRSEIIDVAWLASVVAGLSVAGVAIAVALVTIWQPEQPWCDTQCTVLSSSRSMLGSKTSEAGLQALMSLLGLDV